MLALASALQQVNQVKSKRKQQATTACSSARARIIEMGIVALAPPHAHAPRELILRCSSLAIVVIPAAGCRVISYVTCWLELTPPTSLLNLLTNFPVENPARKARERERNGLSNKFGQPPNAGTGSFLLGQKVAKIEPPEGIHEPRAQVSTCARCRRRTRQSWRRIAARRPKEPPARRKTS